MGLILITFGVMTALVGASLFFPARSARRQDRIREAWPTAKGTVTSSEVVAQPPLATKRGGDIFQYDVSVKYQFRSGGQLHFGSAISLPRYLYPKEEAERIAARYPVDATVTVYHNPEDIRDCFLEIKKTAKHYRTSIVLMAAGVVSLLFGFLSGLG